jgi:TetR/AcrR family transcriptional repressor of nem operon
MRNFDGGLIPTPVKGIEPPETYLDEAEEKAIAMRKMAVEVRQKLRELEGHTGGGTKGVKRKVKGVRNFDGGVIVNHAKGRGAPGRRREKQGRSIGTRERLVETAREMFWERGYNATTMRDIARAAKTNLGNLYYHFKTKDELLVAVLEKYKEMLRPALLAPVWQKVSDPIERIFGLLAVYREAIVATDFGYGCPIGRLAMEIDPGLRDAHAGIAANFEGWAQAVQECLETARSRLPKALDMRRLSRFVLTVMEGGVMQSRSYRSVEPFDQCVGVLRDYFKRLMDEGKAQGMAYRGTLKT